MDDNVKFITVERAQQDIETLYNEKIKDYLCGLPHIKTFELKSGRTSAVFTGIPTDRNYIVDFLSSNGASYISLDTSVSGQITAKYKPQSEDVTIYCIIEEI